MHAQAARAVTELPLQPERGRRRGSVRRGGARPAQLSSSLCITPRHCRIALRPGPARSIGKSVSICTAAQPY